LDIDRTLGILNAISLGLLRIVEIILPLMMVVFIGIFKALFVTVSSFKPSVQRMKQLQSNNNQDQI